MIIIRRFGRLWFSTYIWTVMLIIGPPAWCVVLLLRSRAARWQFIRRFGSVLCRCGRVAVSIEGSLPGRDGPFVIVANHESFLDPLTLMLTFSSPIVFVAGSHLGSQRIAGPLLRSLGCEFVGGGSSESPSAVLHRLEAVLQRGETLAIFPEGSLSSTPGIRRFRSGAFVVAAHCSCPVIPVGIRGTREIVRPGQHSVQTGSVQVKIGAPMDPPEDLPRSIVNFAAQARDAVSALTESLTRIADNADH